MLLQVITAALLLNIGVASTPVQNVELFNQISVENSWDRGPSESCLAHLYTVAAVEWNSTQDLMRQNHINGDLVITQSEVNTYILTYGGFSTWEICSED